MREKNEIFADGVGEITLSGGMVRMDLVSLTGSQRNQEDQPRMEPTCRVVMPPDGFLRSFSAMEDLVKQLVNAGLVKRREDGGGAEMSGQGGFGQQDRTEGPKSPNFPN